ncbi:MAG: 1,4-dihydroxy-6-naphthoate synthase [Bacteroidetes bacterium]|nr:1,4-dihydroxy-6-naphthoate synthase [Bacteroidota bacterium]
MKLSLGFSPCPNDTFIFDALVHQKVDTEGLEFEYVLADVEELNSRAFQGELDVTKVSYHALLYLIDQYTLLDSGSALGYGVGPLLISNKALNRSEIANCKVAIPGKYTTANLLFQLAYPSAGNTVALLFSDIEDAILDGSVDAGVIIHENRFTYREKGLMKLDDLGEFWERLTSYPIPLGGIVAHRRLKKEVLHRFSRALKRSVEYAQTSNQLSDFVRCNAQEMNEAVMWQHISLYVNESTLSLGEKGRISVIRLFELAKEQKLISSIPLELFFSEAQI